MSEYNLYWGELHTHTALADGADKIEHTLADAKFLDFWAMTDHGQILPEHGESLCLVQTDQNDCL